MRNLKLLLVLALAAPLHAAAPTRTSLPSLPILPGSAIAAASAVTTLSPSLGLTSSLSAPGVPLSQSAQIPTPVPQIAVTPAPAYSALVQGAANEPLPVSERLEELFGKLDVKYFLPEGSPTAKVRARVRSQLLAAARDYSNPEAELLKTVAVEADKALVKIQDRLNKSMIDPSAKIRLSESDPAVPVSYRPTRIGVYPVAADPFQWGHLLIALRAVGELNVDKVVFVLA